MKLTTPPSWKVPRSLRKQLDRPGVRIAEAALWKCSGCGAENVTVLTRNRLAWCQCAKVVVLPAKGAPHA